MSTATISSQPYAIFPTLVGLGYSQKRSPIWKTIVQETASGLDNAIGLMSYPQYMWELTFDVLRNNAGFNEFQTLLAFYNQCQGQQIPFCYLDPIDNTAAPNTAVSWNYGQLFGTGNGSATVFQLFRAVTNIAGTIISYDPVLAPYGAVTIYINGVAQSPGSVSSVSNLGVVTFSSPPASSASLQWTGTYYWICRFLDDTEEFELPMSTFYQLKKLQFRSKKLYSLGTSA